MVAEGVPLSRIERCLHAVGAPTATSATVPGPMEVTIASSDERQSVRLEVDVPADAERLVLVDDDGNEYHFGSGMWVKRGTFLHVATYSPDDGLQKYAFFWELADAISEGRVSHQPEPELGPKLSRRAVIALKELRMLCNLHNGFYGEPEKRWAVDTLRALWEEAHERYDPQEVYVWAATHGWAMKDAKRLQEIAEGVRQGKNFQGYDRRPIPRDRERWRRMIEQWDKDIAEEEGDGEALAD
jgi:hypothetical protein